MNKTTIHPYYIPFYSCKLYYKFTKISNKNNQDLGITMRFIKLIIKHV